MCDIKRLLHAFLATSLLASASTAIATAAPPHHSTATHASVDRSNDRDGDKGKHDAGEDKTDKRDQGDKRDKRDQGDRGNPPA